MLLTVKYKIINPFVNIVQHAFKDRNSYLKAQNLFIKKFNGIVITIEIIGTNMTDILIKLNKEKVIKNDNSQVEP